MLLAFGLFVRRYSDCRINCTHVDCPFTANAAYLPQRFITYVTHSPFSYRRTALNAAFGCVGSLTTGSKSARASQIPAHQRMQYGFVLAMYYSVAWVLHVIRFFFLLWISVSSTVETSEANSVVEYGLLTYCTVIQFHNRQNKFSCSRSGKRRISIRKCIDFLIDNTRRNYVYWLIQDIVKQISSNFQELTQKEILYAFS